SLGWTNALGDRVVSSESEHPPALNIAEQPHFSVHRDRRDTGLFIGTPFRSKVTGGWIATASRRIEDENGRFLGVIAAIIDINFFPDRYKRIAGSGPLTFTLVFDDGAILARYPDPQALVGTKVGRLSPVFTGPLPTTAPATMRATNSLDGITRIVSYRAIREFGLYAAASIPLSSALAPWCSRVRVTGSLSVLAILGALAAAIVIRRKE